MKLIEFDDLLYRVATITKNCYIPTDLFLIYAMMTAKLLNIPNAPIIDKITDEQNQTQEGISGAV